MKNLLVLTILLGSASCTTLQFRSNNTVPVTFGGNPKHLKEISITGSRNFTFWGIDPDHHEVLIDEEVRSAGHDGISKLIIYEQKNPQDILVSFLTFGLFMPRSYVITGFSSGNVLDDELEDSAPPTVKN